MAAPIIFWASTWWSSATLSVTNLTGTPADLLQADEGSYLIVTAPGNIVVTIDCGSAREISHIAVNGEALLGLTVAVERSSNGSDWTSVTLSGTTLGNNLANLVAFAANQTYRYFRLTIASAGATARLYHVAANKALAWPYLSAGFDAVGYKPDTTVLKSPQGHLIGMQRNGCTRELNIDFGQLTGTEVASVTALFDECIRNPQGFFFQPDTSAAATYFGHAVPDQKYGCPQPLGGLYNPTRIDFIARVP